MKKCFKLEQGQVVQVTDGSGNIFLFVEPDAAEKVELLTQYGIDEHNLTSAQDPHELPRIELEENHLAVIFKHPKHYSAKDNFVFKINSVGLFLYKDRLVIVAPSDLAMFAGRSFNKVSSLQMLFLKILSACVNHFVAHLQVIDDIAGELEQKIMTAMENRYLLLMFSVEKSLVYYVNAISANGRVIERLKTNAKNVQTGGLTPELLEYVDDLGIENSQCLEQAQVYVNVLGGLMDARASIVSNNQNTLIKRLTMINVVFLPLNVLAGIGGMSEFTKFTFEMYGIPWPAAYFGFVIGLSCIGLLTYNIVKRLELSPKSL